MSNSGTIARRVRPFPAGTCAARDHTVDMAHTHRDARKCCSGKSSGYRSVSAGKSASLCSVHPRNTSSRNPITLDPSSCANSLGSHITGEPTSAGRTLTYGHHGEAAPWTYSSWRRWSATTASTVTRVDEISASAGATALRRAEAVERHFMSGTRIRVSPGSTGRVVTSPRPRPHTARSLSGPTSGAGAGWSMPSSAGGGSRTQRSNARSRAWGSPMAPMRPGGRVYTVEPGSMRSSPEPPSPMPEGKTCAKARSSFARASR